MHETHLWMSFKERDPEREQRLAREAEDQLRLKKVRHTVPLMWCATYLLNFFCSLSLFSCGWKRPKFRMCLVSWKTAAGWVKILSHHKVQVLFQASFPHLLNMFFILVLLFLTCSCWLHLLHAIVLVTEEVRKDNLCVLFAWQTQEVWWINIRYM